MASLVPRQGHTSGFWPSAVAGIWKSVGGPLSSNVLLYRSYSDVGLDCSVSQSPEDSQAADPLAHTPLSADFQQAVSETDTFGAYRPVYDRTASPYLERNTEGFRIYQLPRGRNPTILETQATRTALNEEVTPVSNVPKSRNVAQESCPDLPRQGFGSSSGRGNIHLQSARTTSEAIAILKNRQQQGLYIDSYMLVEILKRCSDQRDYTAVRQVHDSILQSGMEKHRFVATALLNVYVKLGRLQDAHALFDQLEKSKRNVITWNVLIGAYAKRGCGMEAYRLFLQMKREGFVPNAITYLTILNASASAGALEWLKEVHGHAKEAGLDSGFRVGGALLHMYVKSGSIADSRLVFERMEKRDVITWNIMIGAYARSGRGAEAYRLFLQMKREGFVPDAITYMNILNASASAGALEWVKEIHGHAQRAGMDSDLRVSGALIHMYSKSGSVDDARLVFNRMDKRNVIIWSVMIGAYAEAGCGVEAYELFHQMKKEGFIPNGITYVSILNPNASASGGALGWVKEVHDDVRRAGLESDIRVGNALVHMYAKSGSIHDARLVFDRMEKRDVITWNIIIGAYAESGCGVEAYELFRGMKREGLIPDSITFISILNANASASAGSLDWVKEVHGYAREAGLESDFRVGNALIHMYAKSGSIVDARLVFDKMEKRDVITWNIMVGAYAESGCGVEAYKLFLQMKMEGFVPDVITFVNVLNGSASVGALEWVKEVHRHAREAGLERELRVGNALVHMYSKSGSIDDARLIFDRMRKRDVVTFTAMIGGLAQHGCGHEALKLFERVEMNCVKPDGTLFVAVLSACCHTGLVDDGRRLFSAMTQGYDIQPTIVHYNCMVDLLGRAGHLEEAKLLIGNMAVKPNAVTWKALLGACRTYGDVELGEFAAKEVLKLDPKDSAGYVLVSNIYAAAGKWKEMASVRTMMQERGVRKDPGLSWIEVDNKIHEFVVGDTSHPETKAIYIELKNLTEKLRAEGYVPDTRHVLLDIDEEDKQLALCSHSEKLAIAYGILRVPRGKPIRVFKNLRVCSDCHTASKLISKVTGREIIAKDAHRFHHFKDGACSCGDYW